VSQLPAILEALTGMNMTEALKNMPGNLMKQETTAIEVAKTSEDS
jgi:hypothetical protein